MMVIIMCKLGLCKSTINFEKVKKKWYAIGKNKYVKIFVVLDYTQKS